MATRLIVQGLDGSGEGHWQRIWLAEDPDAIAVEQESWSAPVPADWLARLEAAVEAHPGALVVAHSLGCVLTAHLAARRPDLHIGGALLVAPADVGCPRSAPDRIRSFAPIPQVRLPFPSVLVGSRNDPFMRFARAEALAADFGADLVDLGEAGHINVASGFGRWEGGFRLADALERRLGAAAHGRAEGLRPGA
ncbi:alpha/beta hydrolase [Pseudoxanthobacter sp.]|uniref:RBBP9/YdeN family alpha/beta hydrolase n=1 Tax=Pseudoxanthobacter sp. TaxID=1925742 RepID=UPI002FDF9746